MKISPMKLLALVAMLSFAATGLRAQPKPAAPAAPAAPAKVEPAKPAPAAPVPAAPAPAAPAKVEAAKPAAAAPVAAAPAAAAKPEVAPVAPAKAEAKKAEPAKAEAKKAAEKKAEPAKAEVKKAEAKPAEAKKAEAKKAESKPVARKAAPRRVRRPRLSAAQLAAQRAAKAAEAAKVPAWWAYPRDSKWVARHEGFVAQAHKGNIDLLFLGDSITDGWNRQTELWQKNYAPLHAANFGIGGDRTENIVYRLENGELDGIHPKAIMLLIGTNNTSKGDSAEDIARGIAQILRIIKVRLPETKVLLLGVYPRGAKPGEARTDAYRANIKQVNEIISKFDDGKTVKYLYFGDKFLSPDGSISQDMMRDYLHLTTKGYQIWVDSVNPVLAEMMK